MKMGHIELCVSDPKEAMKFYEKVLGFEVFDNQGDQFIWLKLGDAEILLRPGKEIVRSESFAKSASNIVLYTNDLNQKKSELEGRGLKFKGEDQGCPIFSDPDGNWFQLVNPHGH